MVGPESRRDGHCFERVQMCLPDGQFAVPNGWLAALDGQVAVPDVSDEAPERYR